MYYIVEKDRDTLNIHLISVYQYNSTSVVIYIKLNTHKIYLLNIALPSH